MPMVFTLRRNFPDEIERLGARVNSEKMLSQHQQRLGCIGLYVVSNLQT
jgi:hypothetical protein